MANEVIKALLVEIDGNVEKLRRELRKGETDLKGFAGQASAAGRTAGAAADVTAQKQANAARAIASATETIARQGKVSGEASKQLITQASNAALFWGPKGAVVGAVGISVIAIVGLFTRVKREAAEAAAETRREFEKMASMDLVSIARRRHEIEQGDLFLRERLGSGDSAERQAARMEARDNFERLGREGLVEERDRLRAQRDADNRTILANANRRLGQGAVSGASAADRAQVRADLEAVERALEKLDQLAARADVHIARTAKAAGELAQNQLGLAQAAEADKEAERARKEAADALERETKQFAKDFEAFLLSTVGTSVDQVAARFDEMIERARRLAPGSGQDAQLVALKEQAVATAKELERITALFNRLDLAAARGLAPVVDDFTDINAQLESARDRLSHLAEGSEDYQKVLADIIKLEERYRKLLKGVADAGGGRDGGTGDARDAADIARELQQAADGALQLAQNLAGADDSAIGLLRTIGQIAGNIPALVKALKAGSGLGIVSAALPILGALSSLVGESPAERQRAEELRANTEAIRELTAKAGLLGSVDVSGAAASAAASGLRGFFAAGGAPASLVGGARSAAERYGLDLRELDRIAAEHGITLNDNIDSFRQLEAALADSITKLGEFGTDLESAQRQAQAEIQIFGVTDPLERLGIRQRATAGRSSALDALTAGLDLGTEEGRARARENAQALFEVLRAGGATLSSAALGSLTGDQLLQAILDLIAGLDDVEQTVSGGGSTSGSLSGFRGLTAADGNRLADYTRSLVTYAREGQVTRLDILATLQRIAGSPLPVPALPSGVGAGTSGPFGGGGVVVHMAPGAIQISFPLQDGDPERVATAVQRALPRAIEDGLYRAIRQASIASGNLRIPRGSRS